MYYSLVRLVQLVVEEADDDSSLDSRTGMAEEDTPGTDMNMKNQRQYVAAAAADDRTEIEMAAAPRRLIFSRQAAAWVQDLVDFSSLAVAADLASLLTRSLLYQLLPMLPILLGVRWRMQIAARLLPRMMEIYYMLHRSCLRWRLSVLLTLPLRVPIPM